MSNIQNSPMMIVDVIDRPQPGLRWTPAIGSETAAISGSLPTEARGQVVAEAQRILGHCVPPTAAPDVLTALVVGYVQSGKTTSFTTVAGLARDNGYRVIIVIAGTTEPLFVQTRERLINTLRLESRPRNNPWRHCSQPKLREDAHVAIRDTLNQWEAPGATPEERRTVLITVMKHYQHLQNLVDVLGQVNLPNVPTLIIDDEGDQAGMNTRVNEGDQSTTYRKLLALKACLSHHSYLLYTATPQAPLLINIVDLLSPKFAEILRPGAGYVGGAEFFLQQPNLVRDIPANQIPTNNNPLNAPPSTLRDAMLLFYTGVAIGYITGQPDRNCSMMVHPSQRTDPHHQFFNWVMTARTEWLQIIDLPEDDPDRADLMRMFRATYDDLANTLVNIPPFLEVQGQLRRAISLTEIKEVNTRGRQRTPQINWGQSYSWILVGGQAVDRGFTVEGLTLTYMPRTLGVGNADTVQQRGAFFWLQTRLSRLVPNLRRARRTPRVPQLRRTRGGHQERTRTIPAATGRPLSEWRREFFLSRQLRPTRDNVINIAYQRVRFGDDWVYPDGPHESADAVEHNRRLFGSFRAAHAFVPHSGLDLRQGDRSNLVIEGFSLQSAHEDLLTRYRVSRLEDSQQMGPLLRLVQLHLIEHPNDTCTVVLMAEGNSRRRRYEDDRINQLFQGRQYAGQGADRILTYPGDTRDSGTNRESPFS